MIKYNDNIKYLDPKDIIVINKNKYKLINDIVFEFKNMYMSPE